MLTEILVTTHGDATLTLVNQVLESGAEHLVLLMRHSAREFEPGKHDLLNPLTDEGRELSRQFGKQLPKELLLRAYSSPANRCVETASLILESHKAHGGSATRNRTVEALGVFYVLDQMKLFMSMKAAGGHVSFLKKWFDGQIANDIVIPAELAATLVARIAVEKFKSRIRTPQIDVLVSHDMTVFTVRDRLLGQAADDYPVEFLDGLVFFERTGKHYLQSHHGPEMAIEPG